MTRQRPFKERSLPVILFFFFVVVAAFVCKMCQSLGWKGNGGRFDILPLVLQAFGGRPEFFDIPNDHVFRVKLKHPK